MNFNHYYTNEELENALNQWAQSFPSLVNLSQIGKSHEGRPIWLLTLTNKATGSDGSKPAIWLDANIHATELSGTTAVLHTSYTLLDGYAQDAKIRRLLDACTFYIVPRINPDGAAAAMQETPRSLRSGSRPYPYEDKADGLHEEDIDGDHRILQMRIPDPNGNWKISTLDARLMEKRAPEETDGVYYRLLSEGLIENYDGYTIPQARPQAGLDFNRNFPFEWRTEGEQHGAGPSPASEPEIRAVVDFVTSHNNINIALTFHTFSRVLLRPYSTKSDDDMETNDLWIFKKLGEIGSRLTGYRCVSTFHDFKYHPKEVTTGAFDDWIYDHYGAYAFTIELWDLPTEAGIKDRKFIDWWREHPHEEDLQILQWADQHAPGGYIDWYPYDHPQLGKVELGGWDRMYTWRNPPPTVLESEIARHTPFVLTLSNLLPHLSVHILESQPLGEGQYKVRLVIENSGFLASYTSQQGQKRKAVRPVRAELELPAGVELVGGKRKVEIGHLEGRATDLSVTAFGASDPTDHRARVEWIVRGKPGDSLTVKVLSERAGSLERQITLA